MGHRGTLRAAAANNQPAGFIGVGTVFQGFAAGDFLGQGEDHSRMVNSYSISYAPFRFVEAAFALHVTSDQSTVGSNEELMVAVGDPELSIKGGAELGHGVALGGLFDVRFPSGSGFFQASMSATSFLVAALASWGPSSLPLAVHLNLGFYYDGTQNLFDRPQDLTVAQRYAAQVSSFNRVVTRVAAEYNTRYVGPFVELSLEPFVGDGAPSFGDSPGMITIGTRVWPTRSKSFQLLAAADIGITGVSSGDAPTAPLDDKYSFVLSRWNVLVRLSYRFDAHSTEPTPSTEAGGPTTNPIVQEEARTGTIRGTVVDAQSGKPVWNAQVKIAGEDASSLAVDSADGRFRSFKLPVGRHTVTASADGYESAQLEVEVSQEGGTALLRLNPKTSVVPGTLRGTIRALVGRNPQSATILIPELDKTITVDQSGTFSIQLKAGEYKVVVSAGGFRTQTKKIRVMEGSTVILNVELHK